MQIASILVFAALVWSAGAVQAQEVDRGAFLHDTYCVMCHEPRVYTREDRIARDYREIREQVVRWAGNIGLKWDSADIGRVATHIASRYYRLRCPDEC